MIDLSNYPKLQKDIQSNQTSLIPLVVIDSESNNPIYISTVKGLFDGNTFWEDRGLKISSIKESVNLESSKFKVNNLSLTLNNFVMNGERFSDVVLERGLLNKDVEVYYKTQSCKKLEDCMPVYKGSIKRFEHESKSAKIQLEDRTEDKINQIIPKANTGYKSNVFSKDYINTPIPILYGRVDKAPAIPFLSQTSIHTESKILITCDDTLGDNPRIKLGNNFIDDSTKSFLEEDTVNPLYIYKDDYFQVLENYDLNAITGSVDDWTWLEYDQYSIKDGYLEVVKKYSGLTAKNPPADNELQCVKLRFPNDLISLPNPSSEDDEWYDSNNFGVTYEQPTIKSRELAFDNPFFSESKSSYFKVGTQDYVESFAQIPDATLVSEDDADSYLIRQDVRFGSNKGIYNDIVPTASNIRMQFEVMSFLQRYSHVNNSVEDPRIQYIRLPSGFTIEKRLNRWLFAQYFAQIPASSLTPDNFDILSYYDDNNFAVPNMIEASNTYRVVNASASISKWFCRAWATATGFTNPQWYYDNFTMNSGSMFHATSKTDEKSFYYAHNDGSAQGRVSGVPVNYPNFWIQWTLKTSIIPVTYERVYANGQVLPFTASYNSPRDIFGVTKASTSLKNGDLVDEYYGGGTTMVGKYINLLDLEDGDDALFTADECAVYTPLHLTSKTRIGSNNRCSQQYYESAWNGTSQWAIDNGDVGGRFGRNWTYYFGYWSPADWTSTTYAVVEDNILASNVHGGGNSGWFMWIRKPITDIGNEPTITDENNYPANNLRIRENTLIPTQTLNKYSAHHGSYWSGHEYSSGTLFNPDSEKITINKTNTSSRRFAAIFPFEDQEISDDIHTDTYFSGKIKLKFDTSDTGTTATNDNSLKVVLGAIDVNPEDHNVDWAVFDQGLDGAGAILINQTLSNCITNSTTIYDTFDESPEITNENNDVHNFYSDLLPINDVFHDVNNYNSLAMIFRLDGGSNIPENIARFNLDINSVSMLHYIVFEAAFDSPLYMNQDGRINTIFEADEEGRYKYTGETINYDSDTEESEDISQIEKPCDIIYHLLEKELDLIDYIDLDGISKARNDLQITDMAFSVFENIKAKELIEKICKNTNMFALFKGTSLFSFATIKNQYSSSDTIIKSKDVIKYSFTRTPVEKIHTIVNVKYKKDYAEDEYLEETGYIDAYDIFGNKDLGYEDGYSYQYLGIEREDKVLEFESEFIRTKGAAESLRNFIMKYNCNQHNIIKLTLPIKYLYLEVGDVVEFDSLINNVKIYGEDYTKQIIRNGQRIYPYFIIDSINKKNKDISIQLTQLHDLTSPFSARVGSVTRTTRMNDPFNYSIEDYNQLENFLLGAEEYYTQEQKRLSDINTDGYIDEHDLILLQSLMNYSTFDGDVNADGIVNVIDIVAIVNQILGNDFADEEFLAQADINEDGAVDVLDVILLVGQVLDQ